MTREFWILFGATCVALLGLGVVVGMCLDQITPPRWYRRWRIRREMDMHERAIREALKTHGYWLVDESQERQKLEAVATAQDRATRRIH